jgi:lysophospholipase L1-like esterase
LAFLVVGLLALVLAAAGGFLIGRYKPFARTGIDAYVHHRLEVLLTKALDAPKGQSLLIGDSLTDTQSMDALCGLQVFNAGVSGSRVEDWKSHASALVAALEPKLVVVALGTNDAVPGSERRFVEWKSRYEELVRTLGERHLILVAPPPLDGSSSVRDQSVLEPIRATVLSMASPRITTAAPSFAGQTVDGIHPDINGRMAWRKSIELACPTEMR